jgi:quinol monooxygenase YgiN
MSFWEFKSGKIEEGFAKLDRILNTLAQNEEGFRGYMSLLSYEDSNALTVITLWQDEESMSKSEKGVYTQAVEKVKDLIVSPPSIQKYRVYSTQLYQRQE